MEINKTMSSQKMNKLPQRSQKNKLLKKTVIKKRPQKIKKMSQKLQRRLHMHQRKYYHNHKKLAQLNNQANTSSHKKLEKTIMRRTISKEKKQSDQLKGDFVE
jgi:recombinational DNA repair protein RecT